MSIKSESTKAIRGGQRFLADITFPGLIESRIFAAEIFKGRFEISRVPKIPAGYACFFAKDIPGRNRILKNLENAPLLADSEINYKDQPLCVVAGEDPEVLAALIEKMSVTYREELPVLSLDTQNARIRSESLTETNNEIETVLKHSERIVTGDYQVNAQEYQFLETQTAVARWEKGLLTVYCPTKNPFHVHENVAAVLGLPAERISIIVPDSVQDPGEKETLPAVIGSLAALVAFLTGKPARVTIDNTIKQYPALIRHTTGLSKEGLITGTEAELYMDMGAFSLRSPHLFRRAVYPLLGAYRAEARSINAHAIETNKVPYTRMINGGAFESFFACELHLARLARAAGVDPFSFRKANLFRAASRATKGPDPAGTVVKTIDDVVRASDFTRKYASFEALRGKSEKSFDPEERLRGIGSALVFFGFDFLDEAEQQERHSVKLALEKDNTLRIMTSAVEMGQGLKRLFTTIAVRVLRIDPEDVLIESLDTSRVPDSGPVYETRAVTVIGKLIEQGCELLKTKQGKTGKAVTVTRSDTRQTARLEGTGMLFRGDDASAIPWCATVIEVEIEPAAYRVTVKGIWLTLEAGTILDRSLAVAHIEKEVLSALESIDYTPFLHRHKRRRRTRLPPITIRFIEEPSVNGPLGAKGIGELPSLGVAPALIAAVSQATGHDFTFLPLGPAQIEAVMEGK